MKNEKKSLALVIILSIFAFFLLTTSLILLLGVNALSIGNLFAAALTSSYLMILFKRRDDYLRRDSRRTQIPFILFAILVIPVITTLSILIIYSYEIYLVIISFLMPLTFTTVMFYLPIAIYEKYLSNNEHN